MSDEFLRGATLKDVAELAGVSISTASRVLDPRSTAKDSATSKRVRDASETLGYRRDHAASSLRRQGTSTIGVIVPRLSDAVMGILYEEIARECERHDLSALVATTQDDPDRGRQAVRSLLSRKVDALILTTARVDDGLAAELRAEKIPHVLALRADGVSPSAVTDDELGGYLAVRHLADLGHRRIGLICGPLYASSAVCRLAGSRRAVRELGLDDDPALIVGEGFSVEAGDESMEQLLALRVPPTAVFAVTDHAAIGAMAAIARHGVSVPAQISVVGYNDIPLARHLPTPLSSVRASLDLIAQGAVRMLANGGREDHLVFPPTMIPRSTTSRLT